MATSLHPGPLPVKWPARSHVYGIRIALLLAFLAVCLSWYFFENAAATQHDRANMGEFEAAWVSYLFMVFFCVPLAASFALLTFPDRRPVAAGAGIAAGFFSMALLVSPFMLLSLFLLLGLSGVNHGRDRGLVHVGFCLLAFLTLGVWIVVSALLIGKAQWSVFLVAFFATGFYLLIGFPRLRLVEYRAQQKVQRQKEQATFKLMEPAVLARQRIVSLTDCLLQDHMMHPEAGFPTSLASFPPGPGCALAPAPDTIPEYTFTYAPSTDRATGRVLDFRLTAVPNARGVRSRNPLMTDKRGIVFVDFPWEITNVAPKIMVLPSDRYYSQIDRLKENIAGYIQNKAKGVAPASLTEEMFLPVSQTPAIREDGTVLSTGTYDVRYFPLNAHTSGALTLSAQCKSYGRMCLRSFFMDYEGNIYATAEPREANARDPLSPQCELGYSECTDVFWVP